MRARHGAGWSAALVLLGCAAAILPFAPSFPAAELDSSWMFAVNAAVGQRLAFGRDLIFTFGPYASLYTLNYHPATDRLAMATGLVLAVALAAGLVALTARRGRWCAVLLVGLLSLLWLRDPLFFIVPLVFLAIVARSVALPGRPTPGLMAATGLLVLALALLPLIKGTFAAGTAVALGLGGLLLLIRGRWRSGLALSILFLAAMGAFWLFAHQRLADLPGFFAAQSRIVGGYTEAMALPGPLWQVALFAAGAAALLLLNLRAALRDGVPGLAVLLGAAILLFLAFKAGFVRQDEHVAIAAGALGLIGAVLAAANGGAAPALGLVAGLAGWAVLDPTAGTFEPRHALLQAETALVGMGQGMLDRLHGSPELHRRYAEALAQIRSEHVLPPLTGSSDIYSTGQSVLLAHGLPWSPRPVLQSYSAYSPALETADADHLLDGAAPQNVLISLEPIDNRLPALEDGLSWLPLLARYEATSLQGGTAILRRRAGAASPLGLGLLEPQSHHALGEAVALSSPGGLPLWAELDVQPTPLGRILAALFKPPSLSIVMRLASGKVYAFRYVSGMGRAGFLIAPLVGDAAELLALQLPDLQAFNDDRPASFSIEGDARYWQRDYTASLTPLHLQPRPEVRGVLFKAPQAIAPAGEPGGKCWLDLLNGEVVDHTRPLALTGLVRLNGWGFDDTGAGAEPQAVAVSLRGGDGTVAAVPAMIQARPDVGRHFDHPQLARIGYQALLDLRALSGQFSLALELTAGAHHWRCPLMAPVEITAAP